MRTVVRLGDPGIDARWVRRRSLGGAFASVWAVATTVGLGVMAAGKLGPLGWIEGWQMRTFGVASPILAVLPFMALPFAPGLARLLPIDTAHPFLLGIQQAFAPASGPRFEPTADMRGRRIATMRHIATAVLAGGLATMTAGGIWSLRASSTPIAPPTTVAYEDVVRGNGLPSGAVSLSGAIEQEPTWLQQVQVRGSTVRTEWRVLASSGDHGPWRLVQKVAVGVDDDGRFHAYSRPALVGRLHPLDEWTAARLREAGFVLAQHPLVLERSLGDHGDAIDASMPVLLMAMLGSVAVFLGGILRWRLGQMAR